MPDGRLSAAPDAALTTTLPAHPARDLRIGGFTPFSSADWPGRFVAVVFVQGCPWRCRYCHNPKLQRRDRAAALAPHWADVLAWLPRRVGLLDGVVFSGGEPTLDPALGDAVSAVKALGLRVGLHTAGIYPQRLQAVLPLLDWVGLDVKAPLGGALGNALEDASADAVANSHRHDHITGVRGSAAPVARSLQALRLSGVDFECRTTAHPALLDEAALLSLGRQMAQAAVPRWALQIARSVGCAGNLGAVPADYPSAATLAQLATLAPSLTVRRSA